MVAITLIYLGFLIERKIELSCLKKILRPFNVQSDPWGQFVNSESSHEDVHLY